MSTKPQPLTVEGITYPSQNAAARAKGWFTTRKVLTYISIAIATTMVYTGKMSDGNWVFAMAVFIAGHHSADLIKAWRGQ